MAADEDMVSHVLSHVVWWKQYLICITVLLFYIDLLNMFTKQEFKLEMFELCWSYGKLCISIFKNDAPTGWWLWGKGLDFSPTV